MSDVTVELCVEAFRSAFPSADVGADRMRFGARARASIGTGHVIRFAYLALAADERFELHLYPADTLGQARAFYSDPARVERVLRMRQNGWRVEPNFHFGFARGGLTWTETRISVDDYVAYWLERIATTSAIPRAAWKDELDGLVQAGIASPGDLDQFERDFGATGRQSATPRPGLRVVYPWPNHRIARADFPGDLLARLSEAFRIFREPMAAEPAARPVDMS